MNELQIVLLAEINSEIINIGEYRAMVAPHVGEYVKLLLHPGFQRLQGEQASRHECLFRVERVEYVAYDRLNYDNFSTRFPQDKVNDTIDVIVSPDEFDTEAANYLARIADRIKNS